MDKNEKTSYVYLDFNGKLQSDVLQDKVFLRIANLNKKTPLVQVNDLTFKGTYEPCLGTNLFFTDSENPRPFNLFEKQTAIHLQHYISQSKVINLKQIKVAPKKTIYPTAPEKINLNLKQSYKTMLEKLENGTLNIHDMVREDTEGETQNEETPEVSDGKPIIHESGDENEENLDDLVSYNILEVEYEKLKAIARIPTRRKKIEEVVQECEEKYKDKYELHNLKCQISQPCSYNFPEVTNINEDTLSNIINIDRCVLYRIIQPSNKYPRKLTVKEKHNLLTLENFDNLALPARYFVLRTHVENLEEYVENCPKHELVKRDEYGRTLQDTLNIYKKLAEHLGTLINLESVKFNISIS